MLKTFIWEKSKDKLNSFAKELGLFSGTNGAIDFISFLAQCKVISVDKLKCFLEQNAIEESNEGSDDILRFEDLCIFKSMYKMPAIDIILFYLKKLNEGEKLSSDWWYLDTEEKAVIHFTNNGFWYAEAFFECEEELSVIHTIEDENGSYVIPVLFCNHVSDIAKMARLADDSYLRTYTPRDIGDFLSKKACFKSCSVKKEVPMKSAKVSSDGWDML